MMLLEKVENPKNREEWPSEDLLQVAINAMVRQADDGEATQRSIMRTCRNDAALLRQLILPWWRQCTAALIAEARRNIVAKERASALETSKERRAAKVVSLILEREAAEAKREREEELAHQAALNEQHNREFRAQMAEWRRTKASNFTIDDQPFWRVSTFTARQWQIRHEHGTRFVDLLLSGVPLDDRPIGHYRRPSEINELWDKAHARE